MGSFLWFLVMGKVFLQPWLLCDFFLRDQDLEPSAEA